MQAKNTNTNHTSHETSPDEYVTTSAVLLIAFNRPMQTSKVIAKLREVKPTRVYFAIDGPRSDRPLDKSLVEETQKLQTLLDWRCTVLTRFLDENLGCGLGVSTAISWALENEERIIILEDDIIPSTSFFKYCDELLEFYKDEDKVFSISGSNFLPEEMSPSEANFRFSNFPHVWGWAIWKRSWQNYEFDVEDWRDQLGRAELKKIFKGSYLSYLIWPFVLDRVAKKEIDTWDYQLCLTQWRLGALSIVPNVNLTENIGFSSDATHTTKVPNYLLDTKEMQFPMAYPKIALDYEADLWTLKHPHGANFRDVINSLIRYVSRKFSN
jgi:hypothetical protein